MKGRLLRVDYDVIYVTWQNKVLVINSIKGDILFINIFVS